MPDLTTKLTEALKDADYALKGVRCHCSRRKDGSLRKRGFRCSPCMARESVKEALLAAGVRA